MTQAEEDGELPEKRELLQIHSLSSQLSLFIFVSAGVSESMERREECAATLNTCLLCSRAAKGTTSRTQRRGEELTAGVIKRYGRYGKYKLCFSC